MKKFCLTEISRLFCAKIRAWGDRTLPLSKLREEGFLENNKLIVKVEVKLTEEGYVTGKEMFEIKGFEVLFTQVCFPISFLSFFFSFLSG